MKLTAANFNYHITNAECLLMLHAQHCKLAVIYRRHKDPLMSRNYAKMARGNLGEWVRQYKEELSL